MATQDDVMKILQGQWYWVDDQGHSNASKTFFVKDSSITNVIGFGGVTSASLSIRDGGPTTWADGTTSDAWFITVPEFGWNSLMMLDARSLTVVTNFSDGVAVRFTHVPPDKPFTPHHPSASEIPGEAPVGG